MGARFVKNPEFDSEFRKTVRGGVNGFMLVVSGVMKDTLSYRGTGRIYRVGKGKKSGRNKRAQGFHQASRVGMSPAPNTGALRRSWGININQLDGEFENKAGTGESTEGMAEVEEYHSYSESRIGYIVTSPVHYAAIDSGYGRVAPRPYIAKALAAAEPEFEKIMSEALREQYPEVQVSR